MTGAAFRLSGAVRRDPQVEAWLAGPVGLDPGVDAWLGEPAIDLRRLARTWFEHLRACGPDVRELFHDGGPVACVADAPFAYVRAHKAHVSLGVFYGATLADPAGLLEGAGKRMRHLKLHPGRPINEAAVRDLIAAAYRDIRARLGLAAPL